MDQSNHNQYYQGLSPHRHHLRPHLITIDLFVIIIVVVVFITTITIITGCFALEYHLHSHHRQTENLHLLGHPSLLVITALICFKPRITHTS